MTDYPFHRSDSWHITELEDYDNAKSDDERRQMLMLFGYDDAHKNEAVRLFSDIHPDVKQKKEADWGKRGAIFTLLSILVAIVLFILSRP